MHTKGRTRSPASSPRVLTATRGLCLPRRLLDPARGYRLTSSPQILLAAGSPFGKIPALEALRHQRSARPLARVVLDSLGFHAALIGRAGVCAERFDMGTGENDLLGTFFRVLLVNLVTGVPIESWTSFDATDDCQASKPNHAYMSSVAVRSIHRPPSATAALPAAPPPQGAHHQDEARPAAIPSQGTGATAAACPSRTAWTREFH